MPVILLACNTMVPNGVLHRIQREPIEEGQVNASMTFALHDDIENAPPRQRKGLRGCESQVAIVIGTWRS